nr:PREDICTED: LOW QUALITY PROTEIN: zinc finger and BTB domain-containing protein 7C [Bos mutus]
MANGIDELIFFGIPFPNHSSEVLCSLNEQRHDGLLCDVLLVVQEQEYRTHRSVLAACSKYFKKLFTAGTLASQPYVYEIDFVQPEALAAILEFAYTSTLTITASNVKHILNAARMLEIQCIVNVCLEIMEPGGDKEDDDDDEEDDDEDEEEEEEEEEEDDDDDTEDFADQENLPDPQDISCHQSPSKSDHLSEKAYSDTPRDFPDSFQAGSPSHLGVIRDFSIESLLRENLYPKASLPDRRPSLSPFAPDFFPHLWPGDFGAFAQLPEQPMDSGPLDLVIKNRKIKEEEKEELPPPPPPPFPNDFFKDMFPDLPGGPLGPIKAENDYGAYLNFLSATHLGGLFPPWPLVEERKLKPKASQQCPICHKVIMGAGKIPRHLRTWSGEEPHLQGLTPALCCRQDKLKIHMRKHTGERPYLCIHCNAKFVHNYDLKNHMRIHTGVRPYQCEFCYDTRLGSLEWPFRLPRPLGCEERGRRERPCVGVLASRQREPPDMEVKLPRYGSMNRVGPPSNLQVSQSFPCERARDEANRNRGHPTPPKSSAARPAAPCLTLYGGGGTNQRATSPFRFEAPDARLTPRAPRALIGCVRRRIASVCSHTNTHTAGTPST